MSNVILIRLALIVRYGRKLWNNMLVAFQFFCAYINYLIIELYVGDILVKFWPPYGDEEMKKIWPRTFKANFRHGSNSRCSFNGLAITFVAFILSLRSFFTSHLSLISFRLLSTSSVQKFNVIEFSDTIKFCLFAANFANLGKQYIAVFFSNSHLIVPYVLDNSAYLAFQLTVTLI